MDLTYFSVVRCVVMEMKQMEEKGIQRKSKKLQAHKRKDSHLLSLRFPGMNQIWLINFHMNSAWRANYIKDFKWHRLSQPLLAPLTILPIFVPSKGYKR